MPRYFFHVRDGESSLDADGVSLPGQAEAEREAIAAMGDMLRDAAEGPHSRRTWAMDVADETGRVLFSLVVSTTTH